MALLSKDQAKVELLWQHNLLEEADKGKAFLHAITFAPVSALIWMLDRPDLSTPTILSTFERSGKGASMLYWGRAGPPSEALLRRMISRGLALEDKWIFEVLMRAGGPALILEAHEAGYLLTPPRSFLWGYDTEGDSPLISPNDVARLIEKGVPLQGLGLAQAVHARDLQGVRLYAPSCDAFDHDQGLRVACRAGWVPGTEVIFKIWRPTIERAPWLLEAAMDGPNLSCLHLLLRGCPDWAPLVFLLALVGGRFSMVELALENRWLPRPDTSFPGLYVERIWDVRINSIMQLAPRDWAGELRKMVKGSGPYGNSPLAQRATASARCTAYLVSLLDPGTATYLEPEIPRWDAPPSSLLCWWDKMSRAAGEERQMSAASFHLPRFLDSVLEKADVRLPAMYMRARRVADAIRPWITA